MIRDPRIGFTDAKDTTVEATEYFPHGGVIRKEHWDGSVDATVKVKGLRLNITSGAPPQQPVVDAIAALEEAQAEWRIAKHSGNSEWMGYARRRLESCNVRLREVTSG